MTVTTILGSPRLQGNTARVLQLFEDSMSVNHRIDRIDVIKYRIEGCTGCGSCFDTIDAPGCVIEDDCPDLFERMIHSDAIVYATPLYWFGFSAQMKALIDRHCCFLKNIGTPSFTSFIEDKPVVLLVTCDDPVENNADILPTMFDRIFEYCSSAVAGKYVIANCITPGVLEEEAPRVAKAMIDDLTGYADTC